MKVAHEVRVIHCCPGGRGTHYCATGSLYIILTKLWFVVAARVLELSLLCAAGDTPENPAVKKPAPWSDPMSRGGGSRTVMGMMRARARAANATENGKERKGRG